MVIDQPKIKVPKREVVREVLPNGTTFLYAPNPYNQIVAVNIMSRIGSRHEEADKAGSANLTMRMLSTGTTNYSEEEIATRLERNGARFDAEANKDHCSIELLTTEEYLSNDLETVLDLIDHPTFDVDKLFREREIARMNIYEQEDSLLNFTVRRFRQAYYGEHPYSWPSLGLLDTLDSIQRDDLIALGMSILEPRNLIVSAVGGSPDSGVFDKLKEFFGQREEKRGAPYHDPVEAKPAFSGNVEKIENRDSEAEYIVMGYPGCGITKSEALPLSLTSAMLGGSMDSRLFREVRDKRGLCYQIGANFSPNHQHTPLLVYVVTSPSNRHEVVGAIEEEINKVQSEPISKEEFDRVKTFLTGVYIMSMESNMGQASRFAHYEAAGLGWDYANRYPEEIKKVEAKRIQETTQRLFTQRLLTITAPA